MKKILIILFLFSFLIYNLNFSAFYTTYQIIKIDTTPARILPFNLLLGKGIYFDIWHSLYKSAHFATPFLTQFANHYVSAFPLLPGFMVTPIYMPLFFLLKLTHSSTIYNLFNYSFILEKISASTIASVSVMAFYVLMRKITQSDKSSDTRISLLFTLIFAFATQTFSTSSQLLWQHGSAILFLIISQLYLLRKRKNLAACMIFATLAFWSRPTYIFYAVITVIIVMRFEKGRARLFPILIFLSGLILLLVFNITFYHSLLGGYESTSLSGFQIQNPARYLGNFLGVFFSPARGLFFYTPFFIFSLLAIFWRKNLSWQDDKKIIFHINYVNVIFVIISTSLWGYWTGGHSWGDRLLTDASASAVILSYFFYSAAKSSVLKILFFTTVIYSVLTQLVGSFYYPKGQWDRWPDLNEKSSKRLWDYRDNPLRRNLAVGVESRGLSNLLFLLTGTRENKQYANDFSGCRLEIGQATHVLGYPEIQYYLSNTSPYDWLTTSWLGASSNIKQVFHDKKTQRQIESLIPANNLPAIIKSGQTVKLTSVLIPPYPGSFIVNLIFMQDGQKASQKSCQFSYDFRFDN